jgi:hypothetical protein
LVVTRARDDANPPSVMRASGTLLVQGNRTLDKAEWDVEEEGVSVPSCQHEVIKVDDRLGLVVASI